MKTVPGGTFGLALGFFYTINVVVGTGFLGIPYAFYKGGVVVCALAMIVIAFTSVVTTLWVLETMSRAQALERHAVEHEYDDNDEEAAPQYNFVDVASESEDEPEISDDDESGRLLPQRRRHSSNATPTYEIRSERKFDFPELCQRFLGPVGKYTYTTLLSIGVFLNLWTMTSIAATAWSVNVPLRRDWWPFRWPCDSKSIAPEHGFHPDGNCWNNYAIFVLVFALVVTPLSMLDLKRQRFVQVGTGVMRVVVVMAIIVYCIVADVKESSLSPTPINGSTSINRSTNEEVSWIAGDSFIDFLVALPILSYTLAIQVNVPTLSQPMEPKRKLKPFYIWLYVFLFGFYFSLGVAVLAYLKSSVAENCTLYWASLTSSVHSVSLRVLSYIVVIFPSIDVCSSYPLAVAVLSNAIHSLLGHDKSESKALESRTTRFVYRFICAVAPMIGATYVTNLSLLLRYEGLLTFILFFFFPALLHYYSTMECQKTFGPPLKGSSADVNTITYDFYGADEADGVEEQAINVIKTPYSTFFSGLWMVPLVVVFTLLEIGGTLAGLILKKA